MAADNTAAEGPRLPHELIPGHIRDKGQAELRRALIKAAESELASLRPLWQQDPEAWSSAVLCARFMKRKILYICTADPAKPDRRPLLPLDILCEAKVSASAQVFIKCSCEACSGGAVSYSGGSFGSVEEFAAHGRQLFGADCLPVMAETQLSWQELLELLGRDVPADHLWYCLLCEQELPGAPLRMCDGCQLSCHGACYTRQYGQPLAPAADGRVLCVSCQNPALRTLQDLQAPKLGSKAGTARYTVPPFAHEVFRRETNPSHFDKGTYDFWGRNQANLMDALVVPKDSPEAQAAAAAIAAAAAAAAAGGDTAGAEQDQAAAATNGADAGTAAADGGAAGDAEGGTDAAAAAAAAGGPSSRATHVLIATDPDGRLLTVDFEFGKHHKTHGENRKLWVLPLLEALGMQLGDLLVATRPPLDQQQQQQRRQQWDEVLVACDKVLQLHVIRKGARAPAAADNATSRAAALAAANAVTQAARRAAAAAVAAARGMPGADAAAAGAAGSAVWRPEAAGLQQQQQQQRKRRREQQERRQQQQQQVLRGGDLRALLAGTPQTGGHSGSSSDDDDDNEEEEDDEDAGGGAGGGAARAGTAAAAGVGVGGSDDEDFEGSDEEEEEQQAAGDSSDYEEEGRGKQKRGAKSSSARGRAGRGGGRRGGGRSSAAGAAKRRRS